jgi:urease accessory protein
MPRLLRPSALLLPAVLWFAMSSTAAAHSGHAGHDFGEGLRHPVTGVDHLLAMVAVGLLAVRSGKGALVGLPLAFLGSMVAGGLLAALGLRLPGVEWGIAASVLVLGLLVAAARTMPFAHAAGLIAAFAVFHGYAHASELATGGALAPYAAGFLASTALLHAGGIAVGSLFVRLQHGEALRLAGAAISMAGLALLAG